MLDVVTVLRSGGDFRPEHVLRLCGQVRGHLRRPYRFVCLSDVEISHRHVTRIPLAHDWPGWWSMMEMYRVRGPALYMDLDTTVIGDLEPLAQRVERLKPAEVMLLKPLNRAVRDQVMATGISAWSGDHSEVYRQFERDALNGQFRPMRSKHRNPTRALFVDGRCIRDDQFWMADRARGVTFVDAHAELPGFIQSYKRHLYRDMRNATGSIVIFHGNPRPWEVES